METNLIVKREFKTLPITSLNSNSVQPEGREKSIRGLMQSIEAEGLLNPLLVNANGLILIDGHRRLYCLSRLGMEFAECILITPAMNVTSEDLFVKYNAFTKTLTKKNYYNIYSKGGLVSPVIVSEIDSVKSEFGEEFLNLMISRGWGLQEVRRLKSSAVKLDITNATRLKKFIKWAFETKSILNIRMFIEKDFNPKYKEKILGCINKNIPLTISNILGK